jgi:ribosomal protein L37E
MQNRSLAIRCRNCGCLSFSDTTLCPKCGNSHRQNNLYKHLHEIINGVADTPSQQASGTTPGTTTLIYT